MENYKTLNITDVRPIQPTFVKLWQAYWNAVLNLKPYLDELVDKGQGQCYVKCVQNASISATLQWIVTNFYRNYSAL